MIKKIAFMICLGLVSSVAWCDVQRLLQSRGLEHIATAASGAGITAFFGSPFAKFLSREHKESAFQWVIRETYFGKLMSTIDQALPQGILMPVWLPPAIATTGSILGSIVFLRAMDRLIY